MLAPTSPQTWDETCRAGGRLGDVSAVIGMHHRGYVARLTEALGQRYEGMWWVLGDEDFFAVCRDYITEKPSERFNLNFYGEDFPEWAAAHTIAEEIPFLEDLGRFERAFFRLFHAADPGGSTPAVFQEFLQGGDCVLAFADGFELFASDYAVYELWQCRKREADSDEDLPDLEQPTRVALYRYQGAVYVKDFSAEEFALLKLLRDGSANAVLTEGDFTPETVSAVFAFLMSSSVVEGLTSCAE